MYYTSTTGFRVYLDGIKASRLNGKLQVNYLAVDVRVDANGTHSVMVMPTEAPSQAPTPALAVPNTAAAFLFGVIYLLWWIVWIVMAVAVYRRQQKSQTADSGLEAEEEETTSLIAGGSGTQQQQQPELQTGSV